VEAGFKALAKKLHPDHGGVDEEMKLLRLREKMKIGGCGYERLDK
jgi:hypothetical protein